MSAGPARLSNDTPSQVSEALRSAAVLLAADLSILAPPLATFQSAVLSQTGARHERDDAELSSGRRLTEQVCT